MGLNRIRFSECYASLLTETPSPSQRTTGKQMTPGHESSTGPLSFLWKGGRGVSKRLFLTGGHGGGGFFHSEGTWGCAAREGILFQTSSLPRV